MQEIASHAITFLLGTAVGAAGKYYADKYTDRRHRSEARKEEDKLFARLVREMPDLLEEMRGDVLSPVTSAWREFFVIPKGAVLGSTGSAFFYVDDGENAFLSKTKTLAEYGYVEDITPDNAPMFRMKEEFVDRLRGLKKKA
jgi:hypothetical protein